MKNLVPNLYLFQLFFKMFHQSRTPHYGAVNTTTSASELNVRLKMRPSL